MKTKDCEENSEFTESDTRKSPTRFKKSCQRRYRSSQKKRPAHRGVGKRESGFEEGITQVLVSQ